MTRFEQESVNSCTYSGAFEVGQADYPWLTAEVASIPTFLVALNDGTEFQLGSMIGLNKTIEKIARSVPESDSSSAQTALFMGLPAVLEGRRAPGISKVENSNLPSSTLFIASRNLVSAAGLVFAVQERSSEHDKSIVLRAGISTAKERTRLLGVMGIRQAGGKRRQS